MIHWNTDPTLFSLGIIQIRWYGLFFAGAFLSGYHMMVYFYGRQGLPRDEPERLFLYVLAGTLLGARLGHCLFYDPSHYLSHPVEILKIWEGGLASHGGALGIIIALTLFCRRYHRSLLRILDRLTIPAAFGGALIRIGNFMNSEIIGIQTRGDWGIVFDRVDPFPRHPVQLYESAAYFTISLVLAIVFLRRGQDLKKGWLTGWFLIAVFLVRFFLEFVKTPQAAFAVAPALHMGQVLSLPFILAGTVLLIRKR